LLAPIFLAGYLVAFRGTLEVVCRMEAERHEVSVGLRGREPAVY
jgi:hypothetical protein